MKEQELFIYSNAYITGLWIYNFCFPYFNQRATQIQFAQEEADSVCFVKVSSQNLTGEL